MRFSSRFAVARTIFAAMVSVGGFTAAALPAAPVVTANAVYVAGGAVAVALPFVIADEAEARTGAQAAGDAVYYSAVDCPHHSAGVCKSRDSQVLAGLGGGRWRIETRGWECYSWEPCAYTGGRNASRFYYYRWCDLENNGTRSNCTRFMGDG